jgi:hypothetical protein
LLETKGLRPQSIQFAAWLNRKTDSMAGSIAAGASARSALDSMVNGSKTSGTHQAIRPDLPSEGRSPFPVGMCVFV